MMMNENDLVDFDLDKMSWEDIDVVDDQEKKKDIRRVAELYKSGAITAEQKSQFGHLLISGDPTISSQLDEIQAKASKSEGTQSFVALRDQVRTDSESLSNLNMRMSADFFGDQLDASIVELGLMDSPDMNFDGFDFDDPRSNKQGPTGFSTQHQQFQQKYEFQQYQGTRNQYSSTRGQEGFHSQKLMNPLLYPQYQDHHATASGGLSHESWKASKNLPNLKPPKNAEKAKFSATKNETRSKEKGLFSASDEPKSSTSTTSTKRSNSRASKTRPPVPPPLPTTDGSIPTWTPPPMGKIKFELLSDTIDLDEGLNKYSAKEKKNERERRRRLQVSHGFSDLFRVLELPESTKVEKSTVLTTAINRINALCAERRELMEKNIELRTLCVREGIKL